MAACRILEGAILKTVASSSYLRAKRRFLMILDTVLDLFWSASLSVDGDFSASS